MIWALLAFVGVPLWLCAAGIFMLLYRNRGLRHRPGNVPSDVTYREAAVVTRPRRLGERCVAFRGSGVAGEPA